MVHRLWPTEVKGEFDLEAHQLEPPEGHADCLLLWQRVCLGLSCCRVCVEAEMFRQSCLHLSLISQPQCWTVSSLTQCYQSDFGLQFIIYLLRTSEKVTACMIPEQPLLCHYECSATQAKFLCLSIMERHMGKKKRKEKKFPFLLLLFQYFTYRSQMKRTNKQTNNNKH